VEPAMLADKPRMAERALHSTARGPTVPLPRQRELTGTLWAFHLYWPNAALNQAPARESRRGPNSTAVWRSG
jgi:hypothetical protein